MDIPHTIEMRNVLHASLEKGGSAYVYVNAEFGVVQRCVRQTRSHGFEETFELVALPGQVFANFADLRAAAVPVTPEMVESEKAKWPRVLSAEPIDAGQPFQNRCTLCPWVPRTMSGKVLYPATWRLHVAVDGTGANDWFVGLCDEHKQLAREPLGLLQALLAEVAQRKAAGDKALDGLRLPRPADDNLPF